MCLLIIAVHVNEAGDSLSSEIKCLSLVNLSLEFLLSKRTFTFGLSFLCSVENQSKSREDNLSSCKWLYLKLSLFQTCLIVVFGSFHWDFSGHFPVNNLCDAAKIKTQPKIIFKPRRLVATSHVTILYDIRCIVKCHRGTKLQKNIKVFSRVGKVTLYQHLIPRICLHRLWMVNQSILINGNLIRS